MADVAQVSPRFRWPLLALAPALLLPFAAAHAADPAAATACSLKLPPESKAIYDAAAPKMTPTTDMRDLLKSTTFSLIMQGEVKSADARPSAIAAAHCLRDLK
ncbi:MAG TPA: hypothetical protein VL752_02565 [Acidisoma sp.]|uniref:hypothetical protein n=1 Tax=Acidisoma sp. TaxID=1872115 RepID=UPI002B59C44F|nr:hypothetical protein [Acidisoma sp.]HTH99805.1 hypothetical protein [Acidisoma sp.]